MRNGQQQGAITIGLCCQCVASSRGSTLCHLDDGAYTSPKVHACTTPRAITFIMFGYHVSIMLKDLNSTMLDIRAPTMPEALVSIAHGIHASLASKALTCTLLSTIAFATFGVYTSTTPRTWALCMELASVVGLDETKSIRI
jgi:hypothetical protein